MEVFYLILVAFSTLLWVGFVMLPWRPWSNRQVLDSMAGANGDSALDEITVLIPARNESQVIQRSLQSVIKQGPGLQIFTLSRAHRFPPAGTASFGPSNRAAHTSRLRIPYSSTPTLSWPEALSGRFEKRCTDKVCHSSLSWQRLRWHRAGKKC